MPPSEDIKLYNERRAAVLRFVAVTPADPMTVAHRLNMPSAVAQEILEQLAKEERVWKVSNSEPMMAVYFLRR